MMTSSNPSVTPVSTSVGDLTLRPQTKSSPAKTVVEKPKPKSYSFHSKGIDKVISYEQLFAQGHELWLSKHYATAISVFSLLAQEKDRGPRASILLAHCYAMEQHFADCSRTLCDAFPSEEFGRIASELHDIFVMWKCTFFKDVRRDLEEFVGSHPEFPTPSLLLGDLFMLAGKYELSIRYLEQAIERDRVGGAVGMVADSQRNRILKKLEKSTFPSTRQTQ